MSSVSIRKDAPPFVRFEYMECGIDLEASAKSGTKIPLVKPYALIMQHGGKDVVEKDAEEWLKQIEEKAMNGMYNSEWVTRFKMQFEAFQKGNELPRHGTPIKTWSGPNREQIIRLQSIGITTIEDLANIPDSGLQNIGLDGRYLRDLAKNFLDESRGIGALAKQLADLQESDRQNKETIRRQQEQIDAMQPNRTLHAKKVA